MRGCVCVMVVRVFSVALRQIKNFGSRLFLYARFLAALLATLPRGFHLFLLHQLLGRILAYFLGAPLVSFSVGRSVAGKNFLIMLYTI